MKVQDLIDGNESFKDRKFKKYENKFLDLVENGQNPKVLFIACSDSRVDPSLITNSKPGDLFILRNIGNFVPPFSPDNDYHATAAGIEYAVHVLKVTDIIVCGHSHCGAIESLYKDIDSINLLHVKRWLDLGKEAKLHVEKSIRKNASHQEKLELTEKVSIILQLKNLLTYPEVRERVNEGKLSLRGWYYKIATGDLQYFCDQESEFLPMS
ncbi:carbonic anhydrase [Sulfurospirillum arcachonense]|uniref:carbonic anhydrase n=1 Tax=Sulfurospirillum arcachonense TaxID=57666 RepID=UPI000469D3D0|nr:carbonic anhydrase [Sulfurospirillum arcachonense]